MNMTRREFVFCCSAALISAMSGASGAILPQKSRAGAFARRKRSYSVPVLGDIHFDSPDSSFYHSDYTHSTSRKRYEAHLAEHVRNAEMWKERLPRLIRASGACLASDAAFALQMGDLVQGDCGNAATHKRMLDDAFSFVKNSYGGDLPLVVVAGNHDIRGDLRTDGAKETFERWLPNTMSSELGILVRDTTFSFRCGPDVFLVVDFNWPKPDLKLVKRLLKESEDARYTFFVTHGQVVPCDQSRWIMLGAQERDGERRELRSLLAKRNAIVLCGHTHKMEFIECEFPEGRISQFTFNSVWTYPRQSQLAIYASGEDAYGSEGLLGEYKPFVRTFMRMNAAGHYWLRVSDRGVGVAFYGGSATTPTQKFALRMNNA